MKRIGITGDGGFVGRHLFNTLALHPEKFMLISFQRNYFNSREKLDAFVASCDVIVHLAGLNRHPDLGMIYETNINLAKMLVASLERVGSTAHVIFSSSSQEGKDNEYGRSKKEARLLLKDWADRNGGCFTGMVVPNVFGPFGKPFYNSVVATFCYQLANGETPSIQTDAELKLIYVGELVATILAIVEEGISDPEKYIPYTAIAKVSEVLALLKMYKSRYSEQHIFPRIKNSFELNLFNTYRSYENIAVKFPVRFIQHQDERGVFSELVKLEQCGQVSFSTTHPGITRGNHFHTRKIERFAVIAGEARIQLRKFGTEEVLNFYLTGKEPSFVDMPIWYTHNITNVGEEELITIFWINEFYDPNDPDTYFEQI